MLIIFLDTICESNNALTYEDIKNLDIDNNKTYQTNDTSFFDFEYMEKFGDVILFKRKTNEYISAKELLDNDGSYTEREIRLAHNIQKLFRSGAFKFKKYFSINKKDTVVNINELFEKNDDIINKIDNNILNFVYSIRNEISKDEGDYIQDRSNEYKNGFLEALDEIIFNFGSDEFDKQFE